MATAQMVMPFSIHSGPWRACWLAATSAVRRNSQKTQVDGDIREKVEKLLGDYGPNSAYPLSMRIYATILKGLCVINNERVRLLHRDCERVVLLFAGSPFIDAHSGIRLPPSKRLRTAGAFLLDLGAIQDGEIFDWTEAPLEDDALLEFGPHDMSGSAALHDISILGVGSGFAEPVISLSDEQPDLVFPPFSPVMTGDDTGGLFEADTRSDTDLPHALVPFVDPTVPAAPAGAEAPPAKRRRAARSRPPWPGPGRVFGLDETTLYSANEYEVWQSDDALITGRRQTPPDYAAQLPDFAEVIDRLGPLRTLIEPLHELQVRDRTATLAAAADAMPVPMVDPVPRQDIAIDPAIDDNIGDVEPLLASDYLDPGMFNAIFAEPPEGPAFEAALAETTRFSPGFAESPLSIRLSPSSAFGFSPGMGEREDRSFASGVFDLQTAQVGTILHRCAERATAEGRTGQLIFDELVPPEATSKVTAARTFHALLLLAEQGEIVVEQSRPFGPIEISSLRGR